jgi:hypothetical protein
VPCRWSTTSCRRPTCCTGFRSRRVDERPRQDHWRQQGELATASNRASYRPGTTPAVLCRLFTSASRIVAVVRPVGTGRGDSNAGNDLHRA